MRKMTFLTTSSLHNVKKRFHEFLRAQIRFFRYFRCENVQKSMISNRRNGVRVSQNHENPKIEFIHLEWSQSRPESDANLKKNVLRMGNGCFDHFLTAVHSILTPKTRILMYFSCFWMVLAGLNYWTV